MNRIFNKSINGSDVGDANKIENKPPLDRNLSRCHAWVVLLPNCAENVQTSPTKIANAQNSMTHNSPAVQFLNQLDKLLVEPVVICLSVCLSVCLYVCMYVCKVNK